MDKEQVTLSSFLRQYLFQILGLLMLAGNLWLASQLNPLVRQIDLIDARLTNLENQASAGTALIPQFIVVQEKVRALEEKLSRIESKLDELNEKTHNNNN